MRATAWVLRPDSVEIPPGLASDHVPSRGPMQASPKDFFDTGQSVGYHTAMEYRFVAGGFLEPGPAIVWMRMRHPLIAGEQPSPLQRVLVAADSGKRRQRHPRLAPLPVHQRGPHGAAPHRSRRANGSVSTRSRSREPTGVGLADTALYDERGPIGRATQTLLVGER